YGKKRHITAEILPRRFGRLAKDNELAIRRPGRTATEIGFALVKNKQGLFGAAVQGGGYQRPLFVFSIKAVKSDALLVRRQGEHGAKVAKKPRRRTAQHRHAIERPLRIILVVERVINECAVF